jgi:hypothetical protein
MIGCAMTVLIRLDGERETLFLLTSGQEHHSRAVATTILNTWRICDQPSGSCPMYQTGHETVLYSTKEMEKLQSTSIVMCQCIFSGIDDGCR